jgi:hypothetical protein
MRLRLFAGHGRSDNVTGSHLLYGSGQQPENSADLARSSGNALAGSRFPKRTTDVGMRHPPPL